MSTPSKIRWFIIVTGFYWVTLFTVTHIPGQDLPQVEVNDKSIHFIAYALLASVVLSSLKLLRPTSRINEPLTLVLVLTYGAFDELTQPYFHRDCDIADWFADGAGAAMAVGVVGLAWAWWRGRKKPEEPMTKPQ